MWKRGPKTKTKKGRKAKTSEVEALLTPIRPTLTSTRAQLDNSPGPVTRRQLAMAEEASSSQVMYSTPVKTLPAPERKKLTPKKKT
ncbi:hypothetical protein ACP70R_000329 [Stipagrostis hirtigluma subsp. patula]